MLEVAFKFGLSEEFTKSLFKFRFRSEVLPLPQKYSPKSLIELMHPCEFKAIQSYLESGSSKALLLHGPSGSGKTCLARCSVSIMGYWPLELNSSLNRDSLSLKSMLKDIVVNTCVNHKAVCVIIDDVDIQLEPDKAMHSALLSLVKKSKIPIIFTCENIPQKLNTPLVQQVKVNRPSKETILLHLEVINKLENLKIPSYQLELRISYFKRNLNYILSSMQVPFELFSEEVPQTPLKHFKALEQPIEFIADSLLLIELPYPFA